MVSITDDADYDSGETFENVPSPLSDAGNHANYHARRLRTRCVLPSRHDNKTKRSDLVHVLRYFSKVWTPALKMSVTTGQVHLSRSTGSQSSNLDSIFG
ncbi:unnamed protein product [Protopolystoma xenopodis]|uniref:Uncharacterized protein n=1 Tax=Protopolystoma xenopodis TaxID=117903 RepID=A0A448XPW0_9PLAT|nr:unnamed protein product [Protopolystoma xenopodis]